MIDAADYFAAASLFFFSASTYALFNETGEADRDEVVKTRNPPAPLELKWGGQVKQKNEGREPRRVATCFT